MSRERSREDGTIMILTIGFVTISLMLIAIVVDASSVFLARRSLLEACDGAALAGAQSLDDDRLYRNGADATIPLSDDEVQDAVEDYSERAYPSSDYPSQQLTAETDGTTVVVHGSRSVELPFAGVLRELGIGPVTVSATSEARSEQRSVNG